LLGTFGILLQFLNSTLEISATEGPNIVLSDPAVPFRRLDVLKNLQKQRQAVTRHTASRENESFETNTLKERVDLGGFDLNKAAKFFQNLAILINSPREVRESEVDVDWLVIMSFLCADRLAFAISYNVLAYRSVASLK
jgi:hypothetical protein